MKLKQFKLSDGRRLRLAYIQPSRYMAMGEVITKKRCAKCDEFIDVARFPFYKKNGTVALTSKCRPCKAEYERHKANEWRRKRGTPERNNYLELRYKRIDGLPHLLCNHCKKHRPLCDYSKSNNDVIYKAICRECSRKQGRMYYYRKRMRVASVKKRIFALPNWLSAKLKYDFA